MCSLTTRNQPMDTIGFLLAHVVPDSYIYMILVILKQSICYSLGCTVLCEIFPLVPFDNMSHWICMNVKSDNSDPI